jgi:DNA-binding NtrC family response regulator
MSAASRPGEGDPKEAVEVLIVDDTEEVRQVLTAILLRSGYSVHQAAGSREAIALVQARPGKIRFALIDVWMRGQDGPATAAALRQIEPGLRFAFMTGDAIGLGVSDLLAAGAVTILQKPFSMQQVAGVMAALTSAP